MGMYALYDLNITADDGSGANTAVGYNTGRGIVTGVNNTILGANVQGLAATLSNNIILANGAGTIKAQHDGTNWTLTGNVILADGATVGQAAGPLLTFDDTHNYLEITGCNVGIGTTTPSRKLEVVSTTDTFITSTNDGTINVGEYLGTPIGGGGLGVYYGTISNHKLFLGVNSATYFMCMDLAGNVGINDHTPAEKLDVDGNINVTGVYKVDDVQVVSNRVIDARCDDAINSGDATTDGVIDALRDAMIAHGLIAAA